MRVVAGGHPVSRASRGTAERLGFQGSTLVSVGPTSERRRGNTTDVLQDRGDPGGSAVVDSDSDPRRYDPDKTRPG